VFIHASLYLLSHLIAYYNGSIAPCWQAMAMRLRATMTKQAILILVWYYSR